MQDPAELRGKARQCNARRKDGDQNAKERLAGYASRVRTMAEAVGSGREAVRTVMQRNR